MVGGCRTYGRQEMRIQSFLWEDRRERDYVEDPGVDGRILKWVLKKRNREAWNIMILKILFIL
jgi:hypothetical protein